MSDYTLTPYRALALAPPHTDQLAKASEHIAGHPIHRAKVSETCRVACRSSSRTSPDLAIPTPSLQCRWRGRMRCLVVKRWIRNACDASRLACQEVPTSHRSAGIGLGHPGSSCSCTSRLPSVQRQPRPVASEPRGTLTIHHSAGALRTKEESVQYLSLIHI